MIQEKDYIKLILLHAVLGVAIYLIPTISKLYAILIFVVGFFYVLKTKNKNNSVLYVSAYIVGSEVFLRMTGGNLLYESSKYGVMVFLALGMYYSGFSKHAVPFWIYLLLLLPGVIIATETLNLDTDIRKAIAFNISGPVCLGISAIYCYQRKISFSQISTTMLALGLPVLSMTVYLILYTPDLREVLTGTGSNSLTSGGFGPNQVATLLGLGMFVFLTRLLFYSSSKLLIIVNLVVLFNVTYRGMVTFSRGGMITGFLMILFLLLFTYANTKEERRYKFYKFFIFLLIAFFATWIYTSNQTGGLIDKRYANQDALGRTKESKFTGREDIWNSEVKNFMEHPIFGVGVAKALEIRKEETGGEIITSHSEISRTFAEHGMIGILALLIVLFTPIFLYLDNKQNIFMLSFLVFWLLTINHAAMRIAAPAFVYALSLLKVIMDEQIVIESE